LFFLLFTALKFFATAMAMSQNFALLKNKNNLACFIHFISQKSYRTY